ncbi:hypothetical protein AVEN_83527-1 [Araneus ventricosus]|uniref:Uncharacterized protein n=1 Tax=Araneus ventricosus TaxID=182803 RepID=A0A4Y2QFL0_ARAVE|nr:hypothetical protein AVEN_83527-1 [Araneus ventricosus]
MVIRPQPEKITQLQSCAFLHGVDWLLLILNGGLFRLKCVVLPLKAKGTALHWALVGLRKVGRFMTHFLSSCAVPSGTPFILRLVWSGRPVLGKGRHHTPSHIEI